jgi:hypothetical protein
MLDFVEFLVELLGYRIPAKKLFGSEAVENPGLSDLEILAIEIVPSFLSCPENGSTEFCCILSVVSQVRISITL